MKIPLCKKRPKKNPPQKAKIWNYKKSERQRGWMNMRCCGVAQLKIRSNHDEDEETYPEKDK